jgi:polysaccharide pyruvyl transferase CsaB
MSVGALTKGGRKDSGTFGVPCFKRSSPLTLWSKIRHCRLFVLGGGTLLQDDTSMRSLLYYCAVIALARQAGSEVHLWSNGLGLPHSHFSQKLMCRALRRCSVVELRDSSSASVCQKLSPETFVHISPDLALSLPPSSMQRSQYILRRICGNPVPEFIIVAPRMSEGIEELKQILQESVSLGLSVCYIAMHKREDCGIVQSLCAAFPGHIIKGISYSDLVALCSYSKGMYSMRLHGLIAAYAAKIPYRAVGNDPKLRVFMDESKADEKY